MDESGLAVIERLRRATSDHDLDGIVACFSEEYSNEWPVHPARAFVGREQVRMNWSRILAAVPDVVASVPRTAVDGDSIWSEWEMRGTRVDGEPHVMRGVLIFGVHDDLISWGRFYLEPVDANDEDDINASVGRTLGDRT